MTMLLKRMTVRDSYVHVAACKEKMPRPLNIVFSSYCYILGAQHITTHQLPSQNMLHSPKNKRALPSQQL